MEQGKAFVAKLKSTSGFGRELKFRIGKMSVAELIYILDEMIKDYDRELAYQKRVVQVLSEQLYEIKNKRSKEPKVCPYDCSTCTDLFFNK